MKELIQLTEIAIKNGFKLIKENGNKNHIYLYCHLAGKGREVVPDNLKKRNRKSKKTGKLFPFSTKLLDCPFRISYIQNEKTKVFEWNDKKNNLDHNHNLDFKGISKKQRQLLSN